MKNQFIKNKYNQPKKVENKKKFTKAQLITFVLMIFWTISSLFAWICPLLQSSSRGTSLTAYADTFEDNLSNIDIESDLLNSSYLNFFQSTLISNDFDEFSNLDYVFDDNGVLNISATVPSLPSGNLGYEYYKFFTMTDKALELFNQRLLNSQTPCFFYFYIETYDLNRPYYQVKFIKDGSIVKYYTLRRNISYELTDLPRVEFDEINVSYCLEDSEDFYMNNCLPVMFFGGTNVTSTIYNICPLNYTNLYTNGLINGVDSPFNLFSSYALTDFANGFYANYDYKPRIYGWELMLDYLPNNLSNASFVMNFRKQPFNVKDYSFFISSNLDKEDYQYIRFNIYNSTSQLAWNFDKDPNGEFTEYDINGKSYYRIVFDSLGAISYDLDSVQFYNLSYQNARKLSIVLFNEQQLDMLFRAEYNFGTLISAVVDAPIQVLTGLLNFDLPILNINMYNLATSLITLAVLVFILRLIL